MINRSDLSILVYELIAKIPRGKVTTYKILSEACGVKAYRLVGTIVGKNPNVLKVPCHRVVKNNGEVGEYVGGKAQKIAILESELVNVNGNKIVNFDKKLFKF